MNAHTQKLKTIEALEFLKEHPAFAFESDNPICCGFWFGMHDVCKRGYSKSAINGITVFPSQKKNWEKFKHLLPEDEKDDPCPSVEVKYADLFGEPWESHHVEFWWEISFFIWQGPKISCDNHLKIYDRINWQMCSGPEGGSRSFEDAIIKAAETVKKIYGDFCNEDFLTPEERFNHETENLFLSENFTLEHNPKYIQITNDVFNLRWLKWFMTTEYAKKNWDFDFEEWKNLLKRNDIK
ncbi:MAG: hypothetical protein M0P12_01315 [Paludibacteraceae bacterium]|nr:hypothetical protein [Paludibacteraceae bacterium]MCK9615525.1 hypothetical protein [Candidatus Omnitrophota bacterium]